MTLPPREIPTLALRLLQRLLDRLLGGLANRKWLLRWPWLICGYRYTHRYCNRISKQQLEIVSRLHAHHDVVKMSMTSTGVLQCYTPQQLFVVPCGDVAVGALAQSHKHWKQLQDSPWSALAAYDFTHPAPSLYTMALLRPVDDPRAIANALQSMQGQRLEAISHFAWQPLIQRLSLFADTSALTQLCESSTEVIFGPLHGDLHPGNVMANQKGQPVLIDLDRFHAFAPQFIDEIHLLVGNLEQGARRSWLLILATEHVRKVRFSTEQILAYVAFRAAAETAWCTPEPRYRRRLESCLAFLAELDERRTTDPVN